MAVHSVYGGSSAERWMNCAGSTALLTTVPERSSSSYADEGTLAHEWAAWALSEQERDLMQHVGMTLDAKIGAIPLTQEMAEAVQTYLNAVWAEFDRTKDAELYVERGFVLEVESAASGEVFGTNDALVYHRSIGRLVVFDYKHGAGVPVSPTENPQLKFYAAGAAFSQDWSLKELILTIVQPRVENFDPVREWPMEAIDLLEFRAEVDAAILRAKEYLAEKAWFDTDLLAAGALQTGKWCRWCDAAAVCPARKAEALAAFDGVEMVEDLKPSDLPDPVKLSLEQLAKVVDGLEVLTTWANKCQELLEGALMGGHEVPGWKVVEKLGRRKWSVDETDIAAQLNVMWGIDEDLVRPRRLTTLTEVTQLLKSAGTKKAEIDKFLDKVTVKESSGNTIAREGDKRPAVNLTETAFEGVEMEP